MSCKTVHINIPAQVFHVKHCAHPRRRPYPRRFVFSSASNCSMRSSFSRAARRSSTSSASSSALALPLSLPRGRPFFSCGRKRGLEPSPVTPAARRSPCSRARAAMLRDQEVALGLALRPASAPACATPTSGSPPGSSDLPPAARSFRSGRDSSRPFHRGARQVVLLLIDRQFGLRIHSAALSSFSFCFLSSTCWSAMEIATCVLTCKKLVLHVENHLLDHLFRLFGLIDQVVEIRPDQC